MIYTLFTGCPVKGVHISYPLAFLYIIIYEPLRLIGQKVCVKTLITLDIY